MTVLEEVVNRKLLKKTYYNEKGNRLKYCAWY